MVSFPSCYFCYFHHLTRLSCVWFVTEPAPLDPNSVSLTLRPHGVTININLSTILGLLGKFLVLLNQATGGANAGTPLRVTIEIPVDACPEIVLTGLQPNTEYIVTLQTASGDQQSDATQFPFTTGESFRR